MDTQLLLHLWRFSTLHTIYLGRKGERCSRRNRIYFILREENAGACSSSPDDKVSPSPSTSRGALMEECRCGFTSCRNSLPASVTAAVHLYLYPSWHYFDLLRFFFFFFLRVVFQLCLLCCGLLTFGLCALFWRLPSAVSSSTLRTFIDYPDWFHLALVNLVFLLYLAPLLLLLCGYRVPTVCVFTFFFWASLQLCWNTRKRNCLAVFKKRKIRKYTQHSGLFSFILVLVLSVFHFPVSW